jgi:hypothetical protein
VVFCSLPLLIREHKRARCQAEIPLTALSEIVEPPLNSLELSVASASMFWRRGFAFQGASALSQSRIDVQGVIYVIEDPATTILED